MMRHGLKKQSLKGQRVDLTVKGLTDDLCLRNLLISYLVSNYLSIKLGPPITMHNQFNCVNSKNKKRSHAEPGHQSHQRSQSKRAKGCFSMDFYAIISLLQPEELALTRIQI